MILRHPLFLILLPLVFLIVLDARRKDSSAALRFVSQELLRDFRKSAKTRFAENLIFLRLLAASLIVLALCRPQSPVADSKIQTEGIDIVLALDCSTSMLAEDFKIGGRRESRIEAAKSVVKDFIEGRKTDRIGLVAFAARAYMVCPLTLDYAWVIENLKRVTTGLIEDGTAIGSGIASGLNRLKNSQAKTKVIILLTDGRNNAGKIAPQTAAETARALEVKIYTIGAGTKGLAPYPVKDFFGNRAYQSIQIDIDEDTLKKIAAETGGRYFRATDTQSLQEIYGEIDRLEKTPLSEKGYLEYNELFPMFLLPALLLLFLELVLSNTILRKIP